MKTLAFRYFLLTSLVVCFAVSVMKCEAGKVELLRDEWGVPHVFSDTDEGAFYGLGYAAAEDRAFQMYFSLYTVQGRLAELLGEKSKLNRDDTTVQVDLKMRTMGFYRAAKRTFENLDEESKKLLQAYSDGVNDFIRENPDRLVHLFEKYDLAPEEWKPEDSIAVWWNLARFFATEGLHDLIVYHQFKSGNRVEGNPRVDDEAAVIQREDVSDEWVEKVEAFMARIGEGEIKETSNEEDTPKFSHAWVVGGSMTTTGSSVLCSDPQTPVRNPSLLYEFHIKGGTFNTRGVGVAGSPIILIGWNENVAWGMTALGADQADLFYLKTDPEKPDHYFFEGEWREMETWQETIKVKGGRERNITLKETHFGPVVSTIAHDVRGGEEVALKRVPICEPDRDTIQGAVAMMRAKNVNEFQGALEGWRFPSANVVFGDQDGNIGFSLAGALPIRSQHALNGGSAAHDGTDGKFDWQGIFPHQLVPHVINPKQGAIGTANHRAIASFYPAALGVSTGSLGDTDRSWRLRELLEAKEKYSPQDVLDIHYDSTSAPKREILRFGYFMRDAQKAYLSPEALNALNYLEEWYKSGAKSLMDEKGAELANLIPLNFRAMGVPAAGIYGGGLSGLSNFLKTLGRHVEKDPEFALENIEQDFIDNALADAWRTAQSRYGQDESRWNERAKAEIKRRNLGYFETLDGFGSLDTEFDVRYPSLQCVDGGTILSQAAQSYSQWVPMHDVDSAKSLLPIGQSENPKSPYWKVNMEGWSNGELHRAPLSRNAVEKIAGVKTVLKE